jgi:hypothetical protein
MHMAIEMNTRSKILAGVVVLLAAGAGAWFFLFQDDAPPPRTVVTPPKGAAPAAKADAGKPGDAAKAGEAPKAADAPKQAGAAPAATAAAKPIPTNPDQLIAEVIETSGIKTHYQPYAREIMLRAILGDLKRQDARPEDVKAVGDMVERAFEPGKTGAALAANMKTNLDAERTARFLEVLRQPMAVKMGQQLRSATPEAVVEFAEKTRTAPLSAERLKLFQSLDEVMRYSETGIEFATAAVRVVVDGMLNDLQKSGKNVSKEAREQVGSTLNAMRAQMRAQSRNVLQVAHRDTSDKDLADYVKLLDTDTGRWGMEQLTVAARPVLTEIGNAVGKDAIQLATSKRVSAVAKAPELAPPPLAKASTTPAEAPAPAAEKKLEVVASAPPAPVGYQRAANTRELYTRYNDLITATVMRDRAAVKELLDDGKTPNVRQADGSTPLMIAVSNNDSETASMLLAKGADPNLRAAGGVSALSIARSRGAAGAGMVQLLQRSGAKD